MPPGRLPLEVFWHVQQGGEGRPRTGFRDYIAYLAWEHLRNPHEELEYIAEERDVWVNPTSDKLLKMD